MKSIFLKTIEDRLHTKKLYKVSGNVIVAAYLTIRELRDILYNNAYLETKTISLTVNIFINKI